MEEWHPPEADDEVVHALLKLQTNNNNLRLTKSGESGRSTYLNRLNMRRFKCYDFESQKIIGNYIVDFFLYEL